MSSKIYVLVIETRKGVPFFLSEMDEKTCFLDFAKRMDLKELSVELKKHAGNYDCFMTVGRIVDYAYQRNAKIQELLFS